MLEVMVLIIQFLAVFVLQSVFFGILSFLPMVAVIGGFEYAWQKNPRPAPSVRRFRLRFYQVTAWLGFYFPVRLFMEKLAVCYPRPYLSIVFEAITLAVYLTAVFCVTLELEKRLGLSLTPTQMMLPEKSVTAIIGLSKEPRKAAGGCASCAKTDCPNRRKES